MSDKVSPYRGTAPDPGDTAPPFTGGRRHAEWGQAALAVGGLVLLLAPLTLIVNILLASIGPRQMGMGRTEITLATYGLIIGLILVLLLGLAGLIFSVVSLAAARAQGEPFALGLAGLFVNFVGLALFLFTAIDTIFVLVGWGRNPFR
jgi:hypothetical protein